MTTPVVAQADLAIAKALTGPLVAGQDATYTLDVTNLGPSDSVAPITVTDTLPPGTVFRSAAGDGWSCTNTATTVTCTHEDTTLPVGGAAGQITLVVGIPPAQTAAVVNVATVTGTTADPNPANNTATVTTSPTTDPIPENNTAGDASGRVVGRGEAGGIRERGVEADEQVTDLDQRGQAGVHGLPAPFRGPSRPFRAVPHDGNLPTTVLPPAVESPKQVRSGARRRQDSIEGEGSRGV